MIQNGVNEWLKVDLQHTSLIYTMLYTSSLDGICIIVWMKNNSNFCLVTDVQFGSGAVYPQLAQIASEFNLP